MPKNISHELIIIFVAFLFNSCAHQLPPGGGEEDKIPPKVISVYPESGTINFSDNKVMFEFSEYVDKRKFQESIFISPYIEDELEFSWGGKEVEIIFPKNLKPNQTYVITLGTDITDLRRNKLDEAYTSKFSTGNMIDDGEISGRVFAENPFGLMIFLYDIESENEFVDYSQRKPDYITQTAKDGSFNLLGLPNSWFRIIAVKDEFRNLLYDIEQDKIGFACRDILLTDSVKSVKDVFFEIVKEDTSKPILLSAKFIDLNHVTVNFNEPVDSTTFKLESFFVKKKDSLENVKVEGYFRAKLPSTSMNLAMSGLQIDSDYELTLTNVGDYFGNMMDTSTVEFTTNSLQDTIKPKLLEFRPFERSGTTDYQKPTIYFIFDDYIKKDDLASSISFEDSTKNKIEFDLEFIDGSVFFVRVKKLLLPKMDYRLQLDLKNFSDFANNYVDSIFVLNFRTNDDSFFGEISGLIKNVPLPVKNYFVQAKGIDGSKVNYKTTVDSTGKYKIDKILQGSYLLKLFNDESEIGVFKNGSSFENKFSDRFIYYGDTVKVKPRWPTTDLNFDFEKLLR